MKKAIIIYSLCILCIPLYAQRKVETQKMANEIGVPIVCDSTGSPFDKTITISDTLYGGIEGYSVLELLTDEDMAHIKNVKALFFYKIGDAETDSTSIEQPQLLECVQRTIQNELYRGYIVYPESGEWSELSTRHLFSIRVIIRYPFQFMESNPGNE